MNLPRPTGSEPCRRRPDLFYAETTARQSQRVEAARHMCLSGCPIFDACLAWALRHEAYGIWAATTAEERADARRRLGVEVQQPPVATWTRAS